MECGKQAHSLPWRQVDIIAARRGTLPVNLQAHSTPHQHDWRVWVVLPVTFMPCNVISLIGLQQCLGRVMGPNRQLTGHLSTSTPWFLLALHSKIKTSVKHGRIMRDRSGCLPYLPSRFGSCSPDLHLGPLNLRNPLTAPTSSRAALKADALAGSNENKNPGADASRVYRLALWNSLYTGGCGEMVPVDSK